MEERDGTQIGTVGEAPLSKGHSHDESTESVRTEQRGITQVVRNFFGGGTRAQDTVLAIAIVVLVLVSVLLYGAYKDLQTQVWLRSDSLTKENADLRAQILSTQALVQAYGIAKTIPCHKPEK